MKSRGVAVCPHVGLARHAAPNVEQPLQNPLLNAESPAVGRGPVTAGDSAIDARIPTLRAQRLEWVDLKSPALPLS